MYVYRVQSKSLDPKFNVMGEEITVATCTA